MDLDSLQIAWRARLFALLGRRPELRSSDRDTRIHHALIENCCCLHLFDAFSIVHASDLDRLCGQAVSLFRRRATLDVLELLSMLDPERICALYYALPRGRRAPLLKQGDWACCVLSTNEREVEQKLLELDYFVQDNPCSELARALAVADLGGEFEVPSYLRVTHRGGGR